MALWRMKVRVLSTGRVSPYWVPGAPLPGPRVPFCPNAGWVDWVRCVLAGSRCAGHRLRARRRRRGRSAVRRRGARRAAVRARRRRRRAVSQLVPRSGSSADADARDEKGAEKHGSHGEPERCDAVSHRHGAGAQPIPTAALSAFVTTAKLRGLRCWRNDRGLIGPWRGAVDRPERSDRPPQQPPPLSPPRHSAASATPARGILLPNPHAQRSPTPSGSCCSDPCRNPRRGRGGLLRWAMGAGAANAGTSGGLLRPQV